MKPIKFEPVVLNPTIDFKLTVIDLAVIEKAKERERLRIHARREKWEYIKHKLTIGVITILGVICLLSMGAGLMLMSRALPY